MTKQINTNKLNKPFFHNCYEYGHVWIIKETYDEIVSICSICGKIGDRRRK